MQCVNISDISIIIIKGANDCCIIQGISKSDLINLLESFVLDYFGYTQIVCQRNLY